jgi:sulfite oxidase
MSIQPCLERAAKHPALRVRQSEPLNAGPPLDLLAETFVTPSERFFVRNHADPPAIDPASYRVTVEGMVRRPLSLGLADLRSLPRRRLIATLQCAGNRRDELVPFGAIPGELPWGADAISTAEWTGTPLRAVLEAAGVTDGAAHVAFQGLDTLVKHGEAISFGGSIPLAKALGDEVLLVAEMNDEPLPPIHGGPLRVVVPGHIGARSVKWLASITPQAAPSSNYFQAHAYKLFPPGITAETVDWKAGLMLGEMSLTAAICSPTAGARLGAGPVRISGYSMAGGARSIERVELTIDGGGTWQQARLGPAHPWSWRLWDAEVTLPPGRHVIAARAWDSAANTQPEDIRSIWNFKGYMNNAWHRIEVEVAG